MLGKRIKELRKTLKLTQQVFADRIGIKRNSIGQIETGRNPSEQTIISICREFRVNETWLRTGEGDMFLPEPNDMISALAKQYNISAGIQALIRKIITLPPEAQDIVIQFILDTASAITGTDVAKQIISDDEDELEDVLDYPLDPKTATKEQKLKAYEAYLDAKEEVTEKSSASNL